MATKNNPGAYDCYANADPDEPIFILLGRDPAASWMVRLWVLIREGKRHEAELMLDTAIRYVQASGRTLSGPKAHEARMCAADMVKWYNDLQAATKTEVAVICSVCGVSKDVDEHGSCKDGPAEFYGGHKWAPSIADILDGEG